MKTINLKQYYELLYKTDTFVEVPDEIAEAEGISTNLATNTVRDAILKLRKYFIKHGWMEPLKEDAICTKKSPPKRNRKKTSARKS